MSAFRELQTVYEYYSRAQTVEFPDGKFTPNRDDKNSFYPPGINSPDRKDMPVTFQTYDQSEETFSKTIPEIVEKINTLIKDSEEKGMTYATQHLFDLLKFIKGDSPS